MLIFPLLGGTIFRYLPRFEELVEKDPLKRWSADNPHPFMCKLERACSMAGVTQTERKAWSDEMMDDFQSHNFTGLPIQELGSGASKIMVDPRNIIEVVNDVAHRVEHNTAETSSLKRELREVRSALKTLTEAVQGVQTDIRHLTTLLTAGQVQPFQLSHFTNAGEAVGPAGSYVDRSPRTILGFETLKDKLMTQKCPLRKFCSWLGEQGSKSYELFMKSAPKKLDRKIVKFVSDMNKLTSTMIKLANK